MHLREAGQTCAEQITPGVAGARGVLSESRCVHRSLLQGVKAELKLDIFSANKGWGLPIDLSLQPQAFLGLSTPCDHDTSVQRCPKSYS